MVVAIIFVMAGVALPKYQRTMRTYRVRNGANGVMGLLTIARMRAASDFARTKVSCDNTTNICTLTTMQTCCTWPTTPNEVQNVVLPQGVTLAIPTGITAGAGNQTTAAEGRTGQSNPFFIEFNSRGMPIDNSGGAISDYAFYLNDAQYGYGAAVAVDFSGKTLVYTLMTNSYWAVKE